MALTFFFSAAEDQVNSIEVDATATEKHSGDVDATEHPIETGANVVDHVRPKAQELAIEGVITDYPFGDAPQAGRAALAYAQFEGMRDTGTLLEVTTGIKHYSNMVIVALSTNQDKTTSGAIRFSMTMRQIRIVETQTVALAKVSTPKGKSKAAGGKQAGTPATADEQRRATLKRIADAGTPALLKMLGL